MLEKIAKESRKSLTEAPRSEESKLKSAVTKALKAAAPAYEAYLSKESGWKFTIGEPRKDRFDDNTLTMSVYAREEGEWGVAKDIQGEINVVLKGESLSVSGHAVSTRQEIGVQLIDRANFSLEDLKSPQKMFHGAELSRLKGEVSDAAATALQTQATGLLQDLDKARSMLANLSAELDSVTSPQDLKKLGGSFSKVDNALDRTASEFAKMKKAWKDYNLG